MSYRDVVQDTFGNVIAGVTITVKNAGTSTLSTIYSESSCTATIANPLTNNSDGTLKFYAKNGRYDLTLVKGSITFTPITDILLTDPADQLPSALTVNAQIWSTVGGVKFPDNTIQTTAFAAGGGLTSLNTTLIGPNVAFSTGTAGTDAAFAPSGTTSMVLNLPDASATARGLLTTGAQTLAGAKIWTGDGFFKSGRPWIDVRAYGAVGDDITDDTVAFQNAINAAYDGATGLGKVVYCPPGRYKITSTLTISKAIALEGSGIWSCALHYTGTAGPAINLATASTCGTDGLQACHYKRLGNFYLYSTSILDDNGLVQITGNNNHWLHDLLLDGVNTTTTTVGLNITGGAAVRYDRVSVINVKKYGTHITGGNDQYFDRYFCSIQGSLVGNSECVRIDPPAGVSVQAVEMSNSNLLYGDRSMLINGDVRYSTWTNVFFDSGQAKGILVNSGNERMLTFSNCWVSSRNDGVFLQAGKYITFNGCQIYNNTLNGVVIEASARGVVLTNNLIMANNAGNLASPTAHGIQIAATASSFIISDNMIGNDVGGPLPGHQKYAIFSNTGACNNFTITGNHFIANETGDISDNCTGLNKVKVNNITY